MSVFNEKSSQRAKIGTCPVKFRCELFLISNYSELVSDTDMQLFFSCKLCQFGRKFDQNKRAEGSKNAPKGSKKGHLGVQGGPGGLTLGENS